MHRAEFGSAVSAIMTMPHFALILEITPLNPSLAVHRGRPLLMHWLGLLTEVFFHEKWAFDRL